MRIGRSYYFEVSDDDVGLDKKVSVITEQIRQSTNTPEVKSLSLQISGGAYQDRDKINAVYVFLQSYMRYEADMEASDVFVAPHRQIERLRRHGQAWGDCDDFSIFGGALLHNLNIPVRMVVVATKKAVDGKWNHIFFQAKDRQRNMWITLDAVRPERPIGYTTEFIKSKYYAPIY